MVSRKYALAASSDAPVAAERVSKLPLPEAASSNAEDEQPRQRFQYLGPDVGLGASEKTAHAGSSTDPIYQNGHCSSQHWWKDNEKNWRLFRWSILVIAVLLVLGLVIYFLVIDMQVMAPIVKDGSNGKISEAHWTTDSSGSAADDVVSLDGDVILDLGGVTYNEGDLRVTPGQHLLHPTATDNSSDKKEYMRPDFIEIVPPPNLGTSTVSNESQENHVTEQVDFNKVTNGETNVTQPADIVSDINNEFLLTTSQLLNKIRGAFQSGHYGSKTEQNGSKAKDVPDTGNDDFHKLTTVSKYGKSKQSVSSAASRSPVFPTLPTTPSKESRVEGPVNENFTESEGLCFSPRLEMCQGVLPYDLTTLPLVPGINQVADLDAALPYFEMILESGCSNRGRQFICSLLEPACQPMGNNVLLPCRKACRAVAEDCSDFILTALDLSRVFRCDLYPDSDDPSQCVSFAKGITCLKNEFQCSDGTCIPNRWVCDNVNDCPYATDENNCTQCAEGEVSCEKDKKCIPAHWKCDGYKDCQDGSDELNCAVEKDEILTAMPYMSTCSANELRCVDGRCITLQQLCDGKKDCSDGIDEASCTVTG
ncbi:uncharacterized protein LOC126473142 isoform X1 [Schistocerca serialis cubense]|uniref:uncharacterized protein LOC126473142 isoform X1 n=1 Tax=Schistocerca serialis cubense TaxID=2023355 RepID=UPI00214EB51A|nr:uncharacterized protein LOC126473142 isoform X1 [Schistocerca serialis cubense]